MDSIAHPRIWLHGEAVRVQEPQEIGDAILWEGIIPHGDAAALAACLVAIPECYREHVLQAIAARDRGPRPIPGGAYVQSLADVEPEEVRWLWRARIPRGKITVLAGDPGEGKTWAAIDIGAHVTRGDPLPGDDDDGQDREPEAVVYLSAEDGPADTLRPRFDAAEADVRRVTLVHHVAATMQVGRGDDAEIVDVERGLLLTDTAALVGILEHVHPALLVVDPVQGYFGPDADTRRANVVRQVMAELARLADEHGCAILVLMHLNKAEGQRTIYRILDSIDFGAAARSVMLLGVHPEDRDKGDADKRRVLLTVKHNLAPRPGGLGFTLDGHRVTWTGPTDVTEADLLGAGRGRKAQAGEAVADAKTWLLEVLAAGPLSSEEVLRRGEEAGHAEKTVRRAKKELYIGAERQNAEDGGRGDGGWVWTLTPHCWRCKTDLDCRRDQGCPTCGHVRCPECGACGTKTKRCPDCPPDPGGAEHRARTAWGMDGAGFAPDAPQGDGGATTDTAQLEMDLEIAGAPAPAPDPFKMAKDGTAPCSPSLAALNRKAETPDLTTSLQDGQAEPLAILNEPTGGGLLSPSVQDGQTGSTGDGADVGHLEAAPDPSAASSLVSSRRPVALRDLTLPDLPEEEEPDHDPA